jgi:hypothetical protein
MAWKLNQQQRPDPAFFFATIRGGIDMKTNGTIDMSESDIKQAIVEYMHKRGMQGVRPSDVSVHYTQGHHMEPGSYSHASAKIQIRFDLPTAEATT